MIPAVATGLTVDHLRAIGEANPGGPASVT
jgi:hypothetical protein